MVVRSCFNPRGLAMKRFVFVAGMFALVVSALVATAQVPSTTPFQPGAGKEEAGSPAREPGPEPRNPAAVDSAFALRRRRWP